MLSSKDTSKKITNAIKNIRESRLGEAKDLKKKTSIHHEDHQHGSITALAEGGGCSTYQEK